MSATSSPCYSVVIPTFNRSRDLKKTLDSVICQSFQNWEVVVVDDGSAPIHLAELESILGEYKDERIFLVKHESNLGGSAARNTGVKHANGEWICFLDSDDEWDSKKLEFVDASRRESPHAQVIYHQYVYRTQLGDSPPRPLRSINSNENMTDYLFVETKGLGIQTSTLCVDRSLAKICMFDESLRGHQDWAYAISLGALNAKFLFIPKPLSIYYHSFDSVAMNIKWSLSLDFILKRKKSFTASAAQEFVSSVLFRKVLFSLKSEEFLTSNKLKILEQFWPWICDVKKTLEYQTTKYKDQLSKIQSHCTENKISEVAIWGVNDFATLVEAHLPPTINQRYYIDNGKADRRYQGHKIMSSEEAIRQHYNTAPLLILASDKYAQDMQSSLSKHKTHPWHCVIPFPPLPNG